MLKVNEEKFLNDYRELEAKKAENLAVIDADAKAFAATHGYDEKTTADFVSFTEKASGYGLTEDENIKLEFLLRYIETVEEIVQEELAEVIPVDDLNAQGITVNMA